MMAVPKETPGQIDPNVKVPPAIAKQAERAEALMQQMLNPEQPAEQPTADSKPPEQPAEQPTADSKPSPDTTIQPTQQAQPQDDESWQRRYQAMKGRFDQATDTIKRMNDRLNEMQSVIASMQAAPRQVSQQTIPDNDPASLITPKEIEEYGEDFINVVGKKARGEVAAYTKNLEAEIAALKAQVAGVTGRVTQNAKQQMYASLDEHIPNWREVNRSSDFMGWLQLPDAFSGVIRHEMLKDAFARNDTKRVANFFNGFLSEEAATRPASSSTAPAPTPAPVASVDLKNLAAPGRAKTAAGTSAPAEKPIFTRSQIAEFYAAVTAGKYRGREADEQRIERQIFDATREGRIR